MLNNWRSDMGKAGHRVVSSVWLGDPKLLTSAEGRANYVSNMLKDLRYVYKTPDGTVSHRWARRPPHS